MLDGILFGVSILPGVSIVPEGIAADSSARPMVPEKEIAVASTSDKASVPFHNTSGSLKSLPMTSVWLSRLKLLLDQFCGAIGSLPAGIGEARMLLQGMRGICRRGLPHGSKRAVY